MPKNSNISKAHEKRSQISYAIKSPFFVKLLQVNLSSSHSRTYLEGKMGTLPLRVKTWSLIWMDWFVWYFLMTFLNCIMFEMLAWPTGGELVLKQGRQEHRQQLYFLKSFGLLNQGGEEWERHGQKCLFRERTALSFPWWELFNFCSLLTGQRATLAPPLLFPALQNTRTS